MFFLDIVTTVKIYLVVPFTLGTKGLSIVIVIKYNAQKCTVVSVSDFFIRLTVRDQKG